MTGDPHRLFVRSLAREEQLLLVVREELYEGDWDELVADLEARLAGKPYVFRLATTIEEDLERIARLRAYEALHGVDLAAYLEEPTP